MEKETKKMLTVDNAVIKEQIGSSFSKWPSKYANFSTYSDFNENKGGPISMIIYIKGQARMTMVSLGDLKKPSCYSNYLLVINIFYFKTTTLLTI